MNLEEILPCGMELLDPADIGEQIPDPWDDPKQTDWPDSPEVNIDGGLGTHNGSEDLAR